MTCEQARELISLSIDGMASREAQRQLQEHVSSCADCDKEMKELKAISSALSDLPDVEPPPELHEKGMARVRAYKKPAYRRAGVYVPAAAAAAVLVIALVLGNQGAPVRDEYGNASYLSSQIMYDTASRADMAVKGSVTMPAAATGAPAAAPPVVPEHGRNSLMAEDAGIKSYSGGATAMSVAPGMPSPTYAPGPTSPPVDPGTGQSDPDRGPKIIYTGDVSLATTSFDQDQQALMALVAAAGGYVENESLYGLPFTDPRGGGRNLQLSVRVPQDGFDSLLQGVRGVGQLQSGSRYGRDITAQYTDTETRLYVLKEQLSRLEELARKSEVIDDVLKVQLQMTDLVYQIENLQGTLRRYDAQVDYATININLTETQRLDVVPPTPVTLGERIAQRTAATLKVVRDGAENLAIALVGTAPVTVPVIILVLVAYFVIRGAVKRRRNRE